MKAKRARVKSQKIGKKASALIQAIEAGKPIKGMVGYVELEGSGDPVYVKVRVIGIRTEGCGMQVSAAIVGGLGTLEISPCQWLDGPKDVAALREKKVRQDQAKVDLKAILAPHYAAAKRDKLTEYVENKMEVKGRKDFYTHLKETTGAEKLTSTLSAGTVKDLAKVAVLVVNGLDSNNEPDDYEWR